MCRIRGMRKENDNATESQTRLARKSRCNEHRMYMIYFANSILCFIFCIIYCRRDQIKICLRILRRDYRILNRDYARCNVSFVNQLTDIHDCVYMCVFKTPLASQLYRRTTRARETRAAITQRRVPFITTFHEVSAFNR